MITDMVNEKIDAVYPGSPGAELHVRIRAEHFLKRFGRL